MITFRSTYFKADYNSASVDQLQRYVYLLTSLIKKVKTSVPYSRDIVHQTSIHTYIKPFRLANTLRQKQFTAAAAAEDSTPPLLYLLLPSHEVIVQARPVQTLIHELKTSVAPTARQR